jgi:hypothetical protein
VLRRHERHFLSCRFKALHGEVVPANDRSRNFPAVTEKLLEKNSRANGPWSYLARTIGSVLAADLSEELVEVMNNAHWAHTFTPEIQQEIPYFPAPQGIKKGLSPKARDPRLYDFYLSKGALPFLHCAFGKLPGPA